MVYVYVCALVVIAVGALVGAHYAWSRRHMPGTRLFAGLLLALGGWALCDVFSAISPNADIAYVLESKIRFVWLAASYTLIALLALDYGGLHDWLRPHRLAILSVIPVLTQLVIWFGPPGAFLSDVVYVQQNGFYLPDSRTLGPWFSLQAFYGYVLIVAGFGLLLFKAIRARYPYRGHALLLLAGLTLMMLISAIRAFGSGITLRYDWILLGLATIGTIWLGTLFRAGLIDVLPVARDFVIEQMADLVIVLNRDNRVVDFNPVAARHLNWTPGAIAGQPLGAVVAGWPPEVLDSLESLESAATQRPGIQPQAWPELRIGERVYELRISPLRQRQEYVVGRLMVLHDITGHEQIARQLADSKSQLSSLLAAMPDLLFRLNRDGTYLDVWGHERMRSHDIPRDMVIGKSMFDLLPEDVARHIHAHMVKALDTGELQTVEYRLPTVSGPVDFEARLVPAGPDEVISVARDITDRKLMEQTIRQREEEAREFQDKLLVLHDVTMELAQLSDLTTFYRRAIELGRDRLGFDRIGIFMTIDNEPGVLAGMFGIDQLGRVRDERGTRLPIRENSLIHRIIVEKKHFAVREDTHLWDEEQQVGHGWNATAALWNGDRGIGWLVADNLLSQTPLAAYQMELLALYGRTLGYLVTNLRSREALRESEARFRLLSDAAFEGVLVHDDGTITDANPALATMFGYDLEALNGMHITSLATVDMQDDVSDQFASISPEIYEAVGLRKDGTTFPVEIHARPFMAGGRMLQVVAIRDLTHRKQAEKDALMVAIERERVQLLTHFITNATHEFRTPLSVIDMRAYLLGQVDDPRKHGDYLATIRKQVAALSRLVDDLVKMAQLDAESELPLATMDVNDLVHMLHQRMGSQFEEKGLTASLDLQPDLPAVLGHLGQLSLALSKVLDNALRYTAPGGTITLRTWHTDGLVMIEITDTGIGMTGDQLDHIFERFYRADEAHSTRGFGLGLPIAQRVIELHGGWIEVNSATGEGSVFRVALPVMC